MNDAEHITIDDPIICRTVEELVLDYCADGRFDVAFEIECHDELEILKQDWLVRDKITTASALGMFLKLRTEWSIRREIDPRVWPAGGFVP